MKVLWWIAISDRAEERRGRRRVLEPRPTKWKGRKKGEGRTRIALFGDGNQA